MSQRGKVHSPIPGKWLLIIVTTAPELLALGHARSTDGFCADCREFQNH